MSTPMVRSSGAIVTTGVATSTGPGVLSYVQASTSANFRAYDGTSSAGTLLANVAAGESEAFDPPVQFGTGLWSVPGSTAGTTDATVKSALVHYSG